MTDRQPAQRNLTLILGTALPDQKDPAAYLLAIRGEVREQTADAIAWYMAHKAHAALPSKLLRFFAILFTVIGGIMPLAQGLPHAINGQESLGHFGYIFLALAAGCVAMDKFFGFSSNWMRFMTTSLALQRHLAEFEMDWNILWLEIQDHKPTAEQQHKLLQRLRRFRLKVIDEMEHETQTWIVEFKHNLAQLERQAKSEIEGRRQGDDEEEEPPEENGKKRGSK